MANFSRRIKTAVFMIILAICFFGCKKEDHIIKERTFLQAVRAKMIGKWRIKDISSLSEPDKHYNEKYTGVGTFSYNYGIKNCQTAFEVPYQYHFKYNNVYLEFSNDGKLQYDERDVEIEVFDTLNSMWNCSFKNIYYKSGFNQTLDFILKGDEYYASVEFPLPVSVFSKSNNTFSHKTIMVEFDIYPWTPTTLYLVKYKAKYAGAADEAVFSRCYSSDVTFLLEKVY